MTKTRSGIKAEPTADADADSAAGTGTGRKRERGARRKLFDNGGGGGGGKDTRSTKNHHHHHHHNPEMVVVKSKSTKYKTPGREPYSACRELIGAAALYWMCISAPALVGLVVRFYEDHIMVFLDDMYQYWLYGSLAGEDNVTAAQDVEMTYYETLSSYATYYSNTVSSYACSYMTGLEWCQTEAEAQEQELGLNAATIRKLLYEDSSVRNDFILVMVLAMGLAMVRVLLVSILVPRALAPRRLAALTRCKSSHMLASSSYEFSPARSLRSVRGSFTMDDEGNFVVGGEDLENEEHDGAVGGVYGEEQQQDVSIVHVASLRERLSKALDWTYRLWCTVRAAIRRALGHEPAAPYENLDATTTLRLFSAPRYATAIFRCLYCSASCLMAWFLFRSADFWPVYVGGKPTSSTRNCWNRSGTIAIGSLDSDFDHNNAALHIFFLAQAAYQLHSLWFHVLSMALLLLYEEGGERMVSMKSSMKSYLRPLTEHLISITLILLCYTFSGLRRLGAVGIFTLEVSSITLQLLQVCINAPETSLLRRPKMVKRLHRYLVVPSFLYCRFFVFPFIVWYSAAFESQDWLEQIEKVFMPGSAFVFYVLFNVMIAFIFGLNLVFFRRLLFHPHLQEFFRQAREDAKNAGTVG